MDINKVSTNNKRIARNTIMLYIRMLLTTIISLYTVRLTLQILGADDYGIYNTICGVIGFLSFISATLANSAQRYLAYDLGQYDINRYKKTFSILLFIFIVLAIIIVFAAEFIGPWLINNKLVIPANRFKAAHLIFQFSVISILIKFIAIPYTASIVAHERMGIYAYISIIEVILKLIVVYAIANSHYDKLILYSALHLCMDVIISVVYIVVCKKSISYCRYEFYWNTPRLKEIGSYIGWNTFGSLSGILETQGMTIVTNMFFSPVVVAARAIADRVYAVSYSFVANFVLASSPQMVKYFSSGDTANYNRLFYRTSYVSYYLMLLIAMPLIILMPDLLKLWLSDALLEDMILFSQLALVSALVSSLETPISRAIAATGKVKLYQILNCIFSLVGIPICYYMFKLGYQAYWAYLVYTILLLLSIIYRIYILSIHTSISIKSYTITVIIPILFVTVLVILSGYLIKSLYFDSILLRIIILGLLSVIFSAFIIFIFLPKVEKSFIINYIKKQFSKFYINQ